MLNQEQITAAKARFIGVFKRAFASQDKTQEYRQFANVITTNGGLVHFPWASEFPLLEKWVGKRVIQQLKASEYIVPIDKFSAAVRVPVEAIEDDQLGLHDHMFESAGQAGAEWANRVMYDLMKAADGVKGLDGANFFGTHDDGAAGSVTNVSAGSSDPIYVLDTNRPLKPFMFLNRQAPKMQTLARSGQGISEHEFMNDELLFGIRARGAGALGLWQTAYKFVNTTFDAAALDAIFAFMMARQNDVGSTLGIKPNLIVCGGSRRSEVLNLIEKEYLPSGESNRYHNRMSVIVTPHLT